MTSAWFSDRLVMNSNGFRQGPDKTTRRGFLGNPAEGAAILFYLCIAAAGLFMVWDGSTFHGPGHAAIGPGVFPMFVGAALLVLGLLAAVQGWRRVAPASDATINPRPVILILVVMAAYIVGLRFFGFLATTPFLLVAATRVAGSRSYKINFVVGCVIAAAAFFGFRDGLGVHLPVGEIWLMLSHLFRG